MCLVASFHAEEAGRLLGDDHDKLFATPRKKEPSKACRAHHVIQGKRILSLSDSRKDDFYG